MAQIQPVLLRHFSGDAGKNADMAASKGCSTGSQSGFSHRAVVVLSCLAVVKKRKSDTGEEHLRRVRRICAAMPETTEKLSHGEPTRARFGSWFGGGRRTDRGGGFSSAKEFSRCL